MSRHVEGTTVYVTTTFLGADGAPHDLDDPPNFTYALEGGESAVGGVESLGSGVYRGALSPSSSGRWWYRFEGLMFTLPRIEEGFVLVHEREVPVFVP